MLGWPPVTCVQHAYYMNLTQSYHSVINVCDFLNHPIITIHGSVTTIHRSLVFYQAAPAVLSQLRRQSYKILMESRGQGGLDNAHKEVYTVPGGVWFRFVINSPHHPLHLMKKIKVMRNSLDII